MLNRSITTTLAALAIAGASVTAAYASEEALLDALVKKGVLKQADAQKIKAESAHSGSAGHSKIKLNESVKELSIYGDLRLRWQHAQGTAQIDPANQVAGQNNGVSQDQSARFRLMIGGNFKLSDGLTAGVELSTQSAANQRYVTYNNGGNDYALALSKAFIGWNPSKEFSATAGRQSIPFYSTEMVWDNDVRLDGVTEKIDLGALLGLGDGLHLHLISGQFIGGNNLSFNANSDQNRDAWLFQSQLKAVADLGGAKLTVAPGFQWSNPKQAAALGTDDQGLGVFNTIAVAPSQQYLNDLRVILAPGDVSFDLAGTKAKLLWDFAYNFGAGTTGAGARLAAPISATQDRMAWLLGIQVGENKNAGDFSVFGNYREIGAGALNTFYSDSDFALGQSGNQRGFKVGAKYNLTKNATLTAAYTASSNIDANPNVNGLATPPAAQTLSGLNSSQLVTIDLGLKF